MRLPRPTLPARWRPPLPPLPPLLDQLPGAASRRRALLISLLALFVWLMRPWPPFQWLPGSVVGAVLLWAVIELLRWLWWPQRWS
jgi:hypothetical protein